MRWLPLFKKEMRLYFGSPVAYVVFTFFLSSALGGVAVSRDGTGGGAAGDFSLSGCGDGGFRGLARLVPIWCIRSAKWINEGSVCYEKEMS